MRSCSSWNYVRSCRLLFTDSCRNPAVRAMASRVENRYPCTSVHSFLSPFAHLFTRYPQRFHRIVRAAIAANGEPGVIVLDRPETLDKRRYRSLRVPRHVDERVRTRGKAVDSMTGRRSESSTLQRKSAKCALQMRSVCVLNSASEAGRCHSGACQAVETTL
jgi:hypothetical protein